MSTAVDNFWLFCRAVSGQGILKKGDLVVVVSDILSNNTSVRSVQLRHVM
jgi:hypothetical protein